MASEFERRWLSALRASGLMSPKKAQDRFDKQRLPVLVAAVVCYVLVRQREEEEAALAVTVESSLS
jgi:hypothetical protein